MHWIIDSAIVLLSLYLLTPTARKVTKIEQTFSEGAKYYTEGKYEEAAKSFLQVVNDSTLVKGFYSKEHLIPNALFNVGCCYYILKKDSLAIECFYELRKKFSESSFAVDALTYLGMTYFSREDYDNALKIYRMLLNSPKNKDIGGVVDTRFRMAECYSKKKELQTALSILDSLEAEYPGELVKQKCDYQRFIAYVDCKMNSEAIAVVEGLIEKESSSPWMSELCIKAGNLLFKKKQYQRALDFYAKVKPRDKIIKDIRQSLKNIERSLLPIPLFEKRTRELKTWEQTTLTSMLGAVEGLLDPAAGALYQTARCYFALGEYEIAKQTYFKILEQYSKQKTLIALDSLLSRPHRILAKGEFSSKIKWYPKEKESDFKERKSTSKEEKLIDRAIIGISLCYLKQGNIELFDQSISQIANFENLRFTILEELINEHMYEIVLQKYEEGIFSFSDEPYKRLSLYSIAEAYYKTNRFCKALKLFGAVVKDYPESEQANPSKFRMGQCHIKLNEYKQALPIYKELLTTFPQQAPECAYMIERIYFHLKDYRLALEYQNLFLEKYPKHELASQVLLDKGMIFIQQKQYDAALETLNLFLKSYPDDELFAFACANIGRIYYYQQKYDQMGKVFSKLEKDYPEDKEIQAESKYWLGLYHELKGRFDVALRKFSELRKLYPETGWMKEAQLEIANCELQLQHYQKAAEEYLVAIEKWHQDKDYLRRAVDGLTIMFYNTGKLTKAIELYNHLIKKYNAEPFTRNYFLLKLASCYFYTENYKQAASIYKKILPTLSEASLSFQDWYMMSEAFIKADRCNLALKTCHKLLSLKGVPKEFAEEAVRGIATCYFKLEDAASEKDLKELIRKYPDTREFVQVKIALGKMKKLHKDYSRALVFYREALETTVQDEIVARTMLEIAQCYQYLKNYQEAILWYKRVQLLYGYYEDLAEKARTGFEECNKQCNTEQKRGG